MTTATLTLTDFLLARIAEDEATARRVQAVGSCEPAYDPARVLAECEAKRRIVEWHTEGAAYDCNECSARNVDEWPCRTILALAAVYADHPDYREDWRP